MRTELVLNQMEAVVGGALLGHIHSKLPKKSTAAQGQGISTGGATGTWDTCTGGATGTWDPGMESTQSEGFQVRV